MDERNEQDDAAVDQETLKDLDVDQDDADKVLGGAPGARAIPVMEANERP